MNTLEKLSVIQHWRIHFSLRFPLLLRCSAATDPWFQTDMERATTLSQTTLSSLCPVSARARRHLQQNSSSLWCRDSWTWGICAINVTPISPCRDRAERWRRTRKRTQTGKTKRSRDRLTQPRISKHCHRSCWRHQTRLKWRLKPRHHHKERHQFWRTEVNHRKLSVPVKIVVILKVCFCAVFLVSHSQNIHFNCDTK